MEEEARGRGHSRDALVIVRSAVFQVVFYAAFALLMVVGLPFLLMPRAATLVWVRVWARVCLALLRWICGTRVEFRGLQHRPTGAAILAVKHQSFLETFALIAILGDFTYVLKRELTVIPFFGWYLKGTGQIAIDRGRRAGVLPKLQQAVGRALAAGRSVVIFPEGTRQPVGAPPAYKPGVALLCNNGKVPCTPVALNTGLFWPRHSLKRRPGRVVIEFLPAVAMSLNKRDFMSALQNAIETATDALVAEALAADPHLDVAKRDPSPVPT